MEGGPFLAEVGKVAHLVASYLEAACRVGMAVVRLARTLDHHTCVILRSAYLERAQEGIPSVEGLHQMAQGELDVEDRIRTHRAAVHHWTRKQQ